MAARGCELGLAAIGAAARCGEVAGIGAAFGSALARPAERPSRSPTSGELKPPRRHRDNSTQSEARSSASKAWVSETWSATRPTSAAKARNLLQAGTQSGRGSSGGCGLPAARRRSLAGLPAAPPTSGSSAANKLAVTAVGSQRTVRSPVASGHGAAAAANVRGPLAGGRGHGAEAARGVCGALATVPAAGRRCRRAEGGGAHGSSVLRGGGANDKWKERPAAPPWRTKAACASAKVASPAPKVGARLGQQRRDTAERDRADKQPLA